MAMFRESGLRRERVRERNCYLPSSESICGKQESQWVLREAKSQSESLLSLALRRPEREVVMQSHPPLVPGNDR